MLTSNIELIIKQLEANNVVSIPTDTVYGLSCKISNTSIQKIIDLKKRDYGKGFIIISNNPEHLLKYIDTTKLSKKQIDTIATKQSSPTTWIVPARENIKDLTGGRDTVAIRLVCTPEIRTICSRLSDAITSTSANISGQASISDAKHISNTFPNIYVLEMPSKPSQPSKIVDIITGTQFR